MQTFADVISHWPSAAELAADLSSLGVPTTAVNVRRMRRDGIPGAYWAHVCEAAKRRGFAGINTDLLCRLGRAPARAEPPKRRAS